MERRFIISCKEKILRNHQLFSHIRISFHAQIRAHASLIHLGASSDGLIFSEGKDLSSKPFAIKQRPTHQASVLQTFIAVTESYSASKFHVIKFSKFAAFPVFGNGADGVNVHQVIAGTILHKRNLGTGM